MDRSTIAAIAHAFVLAGCSGTTIIDPGGVGGAGGADGVGAGSHGAGAATSSPTDANAVSASTSVGGVSTLCAMACDSLAPCGGGKGGCKESCEQRAATPCGELHQAWLSCAIGQAHTMCGWGPITLCGEHLSDYLDCTAPLGNCGGYGSESCSCSLDESPDVQLTQTCASGSCHCLVNGQTWGFCEPPIGSCNISYGCCTGVFFTGAP